MKLAILGNSPLALEAALRFHQHGAALTWYVTDENFYGFNSPELDPMYFTSDLGLNLLKEMNVSYCPEQFSWREWCSGYLNPLLTYLKSHQEVKTEEVISIRKRFLAPKENIPGRSRFLDLFRIIHKINPKDFIEDQKETNPETYKRLSEELVNSLASTIEMYQDYDLVLDLRSDLSKASASVSGRALGEGRQSAEVSYALKALDKVQNLNSTNPIREIALVGSDSLAAEILINLSDWLIDQRSMLFVVTSEEEPFKSFLQKSNPMTSKKLKKILDSMDHQFQDDIESFSIKLRQWQELDEFVQAKIPKPAEPIPRLNFFSGHNVTAIDELIDRKRIFLTLEKPDFRDGKKHPENNFLSLKTIGVDEIFVAHAKKDLSIVEVDEDEKGFYTICPLRPNIDQAWEHDLKILEGVEDEVFKLFSPVDTY